MKTHRLFSGLLFAGAAVVLLISVQWRNQARSARDGRAPAASGGATTHPELNAASDQQQSRFKPLPSPPAESPLDPKAAATVGQLRHMLATLEPVLPGEVENKAAIELLQWWAEIDPVAAIDYATSHPELHGRANLPAELFISWLDAKGDAAMAWMTSLSPGPLRSQLLPTVVSFVAEQHPQDALRMASELTGDDRRRALSALFSEWSAVDPEAAAAQAGQLPSAEEQNFALRHVVAKWADVDLNAAVEWVKRLPPPPSPDTLDIAPSVLEALLEKWAGQAPMDAARYLVSLPERVNRIQMLGTVAGQWGTQNPDEALRWAAGLPGETDRNVIIRGVLSAVAQSNLPGAADLALSLPAGPSQQQGMAVILGEWTAVDAAGVASWATSHLHNQASAETISSVVSAWAGADLASLGEWLAAQPTGTARDTGCAALARHLAPAQPDIAMTWANAISDPSLRRQQVTDINRSHATTGRDY